MRSLLDRMLCRAASVTMMLAAVAFVLQTTSIVVAGAAAQVGFMPQAAETISGAAHSHGPVRHIVLDDEAQPGHIHHPDDPQAPDQDHDGPVWTIGGTSVVVSPSECGGPASALGSPIELSAHPALNGIGPEGLTRPPRPPGIA
jgi:hypothetical protein